jgi:hypothetical protein
MVRESRDSKTQLFSEVEQSDIDLSLLELNLRLSVEERIQKHDQAARFVEELIKARKVHLDAQPR